MFVNMLTIDDPRAEREAQWLAKRLGVTVPEAIAIACSRLRWVEFDRVLAEAHKQHPLSADPKNAPGLPIITISMVRTACLNDPAGLSS
jgi:hypothetical protein